jgi:predicted permease
MHRLKQDVIVAFRRLHSSPGFTIAAIVTLALGIGANTAIFTAVNGVIFRTLPVDHPEELFAVNTQALRTEFPVQSFPNYRDTRDRSANVAAGLAAYRIDPINFSRGAGDNARAWGYLVTGNYFDMLGVHPGRGRLLHPSDDVSRGGHPVAVISHTFWQRRLGGDPGAVGRRIKLNGLDYTIVGIAPRQFTGTELIYTPEIYVPMAMEPQIEPSNNDLDERRNMNYFVVGRLKRGVSLARADAALNAIAAELAREYPDANQGVKVRLSPAGLFGTYLRGAIRGFAAVLMTVAGLVLLIACVNLASLQLARAADRRKDTAIRLALGASRHHLVGQLLTESLLLSALGGISGVLLAWWLLKLFARWRPPIEIPIIPELHIDTRVLLFGAGVSLLTGLMFGLAPALQSVRAALAPALKSGAMGGRLRRFQARDVLITAQVGLSVLLLVGSALVVKSLQRALTVSMGFEPRHAALVEFDLGLQGYNETRGRDFQKRLLDRVRAMPGIESAAMIDSLPLSLNWNNSSIVIEGKTVTQVGDLPMAAMHRVTPGYFHTARTRIVAGRDFTEGDKPGMRRVAIVNRAFVHQLLGDADPIGKRFRLDAKGGDWREIVGVVEDGKYRSLSESPMIAVFEPIEQAWNSSTDLIARSSLPEDQVTGMLRRAVMDLDSTITMAASGSWTEQLALALFPARVAAIVLGAFGILAIVLAATGVYGVTAYAVSRRTREIGIRIALGAGRANVVQVVLSHTTVLVGAGAVIGISLALAVGPFFAPILYGVNAQDPVTYAAALGAMVAVAFAACWFPARRAIGVDPVKALRTE